MLRASRNLVDLRFHLLARAQPGSLEAFVNPDAADNLVLLLVAAEAKRHCKRLGLWGPKERRRVEEEMKLQHYYGGQWIAYLETGEGPVVVAAAEILGDPVFDGRLAFLTPEEGRGRIITCPVRLFDTKSEIATPFPDEG